MKLAIFAGRRNQGSEPEQPANSRRSKRAVIAVAVGAGVACAILFGGHVAHADGPRPGGGTPVATTLSTSRLVSTQGGRTILPVTSVNVTKVQAGATGQGASEAQCRAKENVINSLYDAAADASNTGTLAGKSQAVDLALQARAEVDAAMDAGCWVIF